MLEQLWARATDIYASAYLRLYLSLGTDGRTTYYVPVPMG
jgi:hypothetical protein